MRRLLVGTAAVVSLLALAACEEHDTTVSRNANEPAVSTPVDPAARDSVATNVAKDSSSIPGSGTAELTSETREYVQRVAMGDMFEVEVSKVALDRSPSADIKTFAQEMIDAHTKTSDELKARLARAGLIVELPAMLDDQHKKMIDDLKAVNTQAFDARYIEMQKAAHDEAMMLHRNYAMNGAVADLKALAADTVPKIEIHLKMASDLESKHRARFSKADKR